MNIYGFDYNFEFTENFVLNSYFFIKLPITYFTSLVHWLLSYFLYLGTSFYLARPF